jgi:integrase
MRVTMETKSTFSILFYLRRDRVNTKGESPIYMRITVDGESSSMNIAKKAQAKVWDASKGYCNVKYPDSSEVNSYIDLMRKKVYEARKQLLENNKVITSRALISLLNAQEEKKLTVLLAARQHNQRMKSLIGKSSTNGNYKNYKTTLKSLEAFIPFRYKVADIPLNDLSQRFINDFVEYLMTSQNCGNNGAMKHVQRFKKIINFAISNEWINKNPFNGYKVKFQKKERDFLSKEELMQLDQLHLSCARLSKVLDIFLFSCYTGLSYVDVQQLTGNEIVKGIDGCKWIISRREKTKVRLSIPLLPKALEILTKYNSGQEGRIFPLISNQKMNDYLKEITDLAGIHKRITFHSARHTFATTVTLSNNVPIETVSKLLGHTNLRTTQIYSRVLENKIAQDMGALVIKLDEENLALAR